VSTSVKGSQIPVRESSKIKESAISHRSSDFTPVAGNIGPSKLKNITTLQEGRPPTQYRIHSRILHVSDCRAFPKL
jgi:hypothetical protein